MGKNISPLVNLVPTVALQQIPIIEQVLEPRLEAVARGWDQKLERAEPFLPSELNKAPRKRPSKRYVEQNKRFDAEVYRVLSGIYPTIASKTVNQIPPKAGIVVEVGAGNGAVLSHLHIAAQWKFTIQVVDLSRVSCTKVKRLLEKRLTEWAPHCTIYKTDILKFSQEMFSEDTTLVTAIRTFQFWEADWVVSVLRIWGQKLLARNDGYSSVVIVRPRPQDNRHVLWGSTLAHDDEIFDEALAHGANRTIRRFDYPAFSYYHQAYTASVWW